MAMLSGAALMWFVAADLAVLLASSSIAVVLFRRLQRQRRIARLEQGAAEKAG